MRILHSSVLLIVLLMAVILSPYVANQRAKNFGGTMVVNGNQRINVINGTLTINLTPGQKLIIATWKEDQLWYRTRSMGQDENPKTHTFHKDNLFGVLKGTIVFNEQVVR